jgi:hypothetical protein
VVEQWVFIISFVTNDREFEDILLDVDLIKLLWGVVNPSMFIGIADMM